MSFLDSPFVVAYWPYLATLLAGFIIAQLLASRKSSGGKERVVSSYSQQQQGSVNIAKDTDLSDPEHPLFEANSVPTVEYDQPTAHEEETPHVPFKSERYSHQDMIERSKRFYEDINKRRTIRYFSDEPVPRAVIENLIRTAGKVVCIDEFHTLCYFVFA